jgi:membrane dipeptidase
MTRRTFSGLLGGAATFAASGLEAQPTVPERVHDLYDRSVIIDCLASPQSFNIPWPPQDQGLLDDQRSNIRNSGITAINLTVNAATFEDTISHIAFWMSEVDRDPSLMTIVRNASDISAAKQSKRLGLMFGFQGTDVLGSDLTRLVQFRRLGVRIMQLTYNTRSLAGDGCLEPGNAGLSSFGRQMVARMDELGIAVDLGHCGMQTCSDAIAQSRKPVLITHTGCRVV